MTTDDDPLWLKYLKDDDGGNTSYGAAQTFSLPELRDEVNTQVLKRGFLTYFSWEQLAGPRGHSEPVGIRWVQYLGYLLVVPLFHLTRWASRVVERSRHVSEAGGYEYDSAKLLEFRQKTKWVPNAKEDGNE